MKFHWGYGFLPVFLYAFLFSIRTRKLSEDGFVGRLSEHFGGKAERTKTPEA
jgi:hypothetical protein